MSKAAWTWSVAECVANIDLILEPGLGNRCQSKLLGETSRNHGTL